MTWDSKDWDEFKMKCVELQNRDTIVPPITEAGTTRTTCSVCGHWWYDTTDTFYCSHCGQRVKGGDLNG